MKLLEYQGKELFRRVGIPVPRGALVVDPHDAATFVSEHGGAWVVKSQVAMGGRGKAGGIRFADSPEAAETAARALLGTRLSSVQNPEGEIVRSVLIEERLAIASEAYVSIAIDRARKRPVALVSARGGMDVEEVAAHEPAAIARFWIDPTIGARPFVARRLAIEAGLPVAFRAALPRVLAALYALFMDYGAHLVEINPLIATASGDVIAGDAKVELDDSGLFRHPDIAAWRDAGPPDEDRRAAVAIGLAESNYARLDGDIGVIANGAGLGMGTMDAIRIAGGAAANFLDIGGGARDELVARSYRLVTDDERVRAVFVNIFGGITRGDQVARGIVAAAAAAGVRHVPLVVRLTGTNAREGRAILAAAGVEPVDTMDEGARRAVALAEAARGDLPR